MKSRPLHRVSRGTPREDQTTRTTHHRPTETPPAPADRRPGRAGRHRSRDAAQLPRLRDVGHRRPRAARRPRRPQAGAPPGALRDVRRRLPAGPRLLQVRPRRRRRDGQLPPARRLGDLRHLGPAGAAVVAALPAGRRQRQLRLAGQRPAGRHALHRVPAGAAGDGDAARHRRGDRRLHAQLRRPLAGADGPAEPVPQPAGQRLRRHRGRHGDQHPAAQPARGRRRRAVVPRRTRRPTRRSCSRRCSSGSRARTSRPAR